MPVPFTPYIQLSDTFDEWRRSYNLVLQNLGSGFSATSSANAVPIADNNGKIDLAYLPDNVMTTDESGEVAFTTDNLADVSIDYDNATAAHYVNDADFLIWDADSARPDGGSGQWVPHTLEANDLSDFTFPTLSAADSGKALVWDHTANGGAGSFIVSEEPAPTFNFPADSSIPAGSIIEWDATNQEWVVGELGTEFGQKLNNTGVNTYTGNLTIASGSGGTGKLTTNSDVTSNTGNFVNGQSGDGLINTANDSGIVSNNANSYTVYNNGETSGEFLFNDAPGTATPFGGIEWSTNAGVKEISLTNANGNKIIDGDQNGTTLYHNGAPRMETTATGTNFASPVTFSDTVSFTGGTASSKFEDSDNAAYYGDFSGTSNMKNVNVEKLDASIEVESPIYYDGNNRTFYGDFSGTSNMNQVNAVKFDASTEMESPIYYDSNNRAFYGNFASTSKMNRVDVNTLGIGQGTDDTLAVVTGDYGNVQCNGSGKGNWEGYNITARAAFIHDGGTTTGLINDVDNEWLFQATHNAGARLYHNGVKKLETTGAGTTITGTLTETSDARLKDNIRPLEDPTEKIKQLSGKRFVFKESPEVEQIGLVAQELETVYPELVEKNNETGMLSVSYTKLTAVLLETIKKLEERISTLEQQQ